MVKKTLILVTKGEVGGAQQSVFNLAKELKNKGLQVVIGFGQGKFLQDKTLDSTLPTIQFKYLRRTHNPITNLLFIWELKKYLKKQNFDVIHFNSSNTLTGALSAKLANPKIKTIFTFRGLSMLDRNYQINPVPKYLYKCYFKFFLKFIDKKIFVSQGNYEFALKNKICESGQIIHNGINLKETNFLPTPQAQEMLAKKINTELKADELLIGSIGRLSYQKNYEFLIPLFGQIIAKQPVKLVIVGEGPKRSTYEKLIVKHGLKGKIILAGAIDDAQKYLKAFDVFVLCSRYEGQSITLLEAMAAGLPILASDLPENIETLAQAGWTFSLNKRKEFIDKLNSLLVSHELRIDLQAKAWKRARNFSLDKTVNAYIQAYAT